MWESGWGTLSAEDWGKGILPWTVSKKPAWPESLWQERGHTPSNQEQESL
jgi:hypothetical protein